MTLSPAVLSLMCRAANERQRAEQPAARPVGGDLVRIASVGGGGALLIEVRPDGSCGEEWRIPHDEMDPELLRARVEWFRRFVARKQGRQRMALVR